MSLRDALGFSIAPHSCRVMKMDKYYASIMRAEKKTKDNTGLPTGMPIPTLPVDYLQNRPDFWVGGVGSYVVPVEDDWAIWFNWTMNGGQDLAVLTSVKGMNPLTGQRVNGLSLEQYVKKCPIHDESFSHGKFCKKCNFKWPEQNYITNINPMYLDGFHTTDGHVRQFYFTEDMMKSVPELVIGKEDTVPAFGFCFYAMKNAEKREFEMGKKYHDKNPEGGWGYKYVGGGGGGLIFGGFVAPGVYTNCVSSGQTGCQGVSGFQGPTGSTGYSGSTGHIRSKSSRKMGKFSSNSTIGSQSLLSMSSQNSSQCFYNNTQLDMTASFDAPIATAAAATPVQEDLSHLKKSYAQKNAEVGVGAGARIKQHIRPDANDVNSWSEKPSGVIRLYFVFREQFESLVSQGLTDLAGSREGYLQDLPVGGAR
ncbi:MAG: hypothetical protein Q7R33_05025 [Nitrosarchaeum sp.]|nr:hypothetical protein [Nitrosarchaeum sp.]